MPDSPPQSTKNSDQRFTVGVTRVCLSSGTLQIPFAMRGVFEPGKYPARDTELAESHELTFEPPRSLNGLAAIFEAHELNPNDEVILTLTKEGIELEVRKRPRRKASEVKGEPWETVSGRGADTSARGPQQVRAPAPTPHEAYDDGQSDLFGAGEANRTAAHEPAGDRDPEDADAPRMVRARRIHAKEGRTEKPASERPPLGRPQVRPASRDESEAPPPRASAAQRFFEDPGDPDDPFSADVQADDAWRWERAQAEAAERRFDASDAFVDDEREAQSGGFFAKIAQAARGALSFRGAEREEEEPETEPSRYVHAQVEPVVEPVVEPEIRPEPFRDEARGEARGGPRDESRREPPAESRFEPSADPRRQPRSHSSAEPRGRPPEPRSQTGIRDPRAMPDRPAAPRDRSAPTVQPQAQDARPRPAAEATPRDVIVEDPAAESLDRFAPAMLEVGDGDLRSRLLRFLQHPDVPVILRTELVARNFGLGVEVADAMLEDLTHDKVDGLVVTKVRDETYRISRAPTKL